MRERTVEKESLGVQAARFSLYAPIAVLMIGCFAGAGLKNEPGVAMALAWLNVGLIVLGFLLGLAALISMRRLGRTGILWRAVIGTLVNGFFVWGVLNLLFPMIEAGRIRDQLVGNWHLQSGPANNVPVDVSFQKDGSFTFSRPASFGVTASVIRGKWVVTSYKLVGLNIESVEGGDTKLVGKKIGFGRVQAISGQEVRIVTDDGEEVYRRR